MSIKNSWTLRYAPIPAFYWMAYSALCGYASFFLLGIGLNSTQTGVVIALSGAAAAFLQPLIAGFAQRPKSPSLRVLIAASAGTLSLTALLLLILAGSVPFLTACVYSVGIVLLQTVMPLINALGTECINQGKKLDFGLTRGLGGLAYALTSLLMGALCAVWGTPAVPVITILGGGLLLFFTGQFPFRKSPSAGTGDASDQNAGGLRFFRRYPGFLAMLAGLTLCYISHMILNNFLLQIILHKGGTVSDQGISMFLACCGEVPAMMLYSRLLKRVKCAVWFKLTGFAFLLKAALSMLAPNVGLYFAVQPLQFFAWGMVSVAAVDFVNQLMRPDDKIHGQAYISVPLLLGSVIGSPIGGWLLDHTGLDSMMVFSTVCAAVGAAVLYMSVGRAEKEIKKA